MFPWPMRGDVHLDEDRNKMGDLSGVLGSRIPLCIAKPLGSRPYARKQVLKLLKGGHVPRAVGEHHKVEVFVGEVPLEIK